MVREKGVKMAVVSSLGELENLGSVKENERIRGRIWCREGPKRKDVECNMCRL